MKRSKSYRILQYEGRNNMKPQWHWYEMSKSRIDENFKRRNDISTKYPEVEMTYGEMVGWLFWGLTTI